MSDRIDLYSKDLYINRELSWLRFNHRLLEETKDRSNPLLGRAKFLAICYSNMDEFFMVRISSLILQMDAANIPEMPDYIGANPLMEWILKDVSMLMKTYKREWDRLKKELAANNIQIKEFGELTEPQKEWLSEFFTKKIRFHLTRLALDVSKPFPFVPNNSMNLIVRMKGSYEIVNVPLGRLPRFIEIPSDNAREFIMLEDVIKSFVQLMYPQKVLGAYMFRITKNAEVKVRMDVADPYSEVELAMGARDRGFPVMVMTESHMPHKIIDMLAKEMRFGSRQIYRFMGEVPLSDLWEIAHLDVPELQEKPFIPSIPSDLSEEHDLFKAIRKKDRLLFHPYEPFSTTIRLMEESANDPAVISINIALYRIGKDPSVVNALKTARKNGKSVLVMMELRAKFDEYRNMKWARELTAAGVRVIYGPPDIKVHSKILQVTRIENGEIVRYTHMSSGNYNTSTAKQYGDLAVLTARKELGEDVARLFDSLDSGFGLQYYRYLLVSPTSIKKEILKRIERETEHQKNGKKGYIAIKANGIIDFDVIAAMYRASMAGVKIDLNIRGPCCLRPGVKGVSDNIRVISIVDRFLEHSRIFYFENGGDPEMFMGSSDLMPRNLSLRVEILFPVLDKDMLISIKNNILDIHLSDTVKARELRSDGRYVKIKSNSKFRSQEWFIENKGKWNAR